ncbi:MAG: M2 family metallopeptidase [Planctomycetes bacterium]|nr:M2 family metallopeptidase [Planctomycetota bacterium]
MLSLRVGFLIITCFFMILWMLPTQAAADPASTKKARDFIDAFTRKVRPLDTAANYAWWDAMMTGNKDAFKKKEDAQNQLDALMADKTQFAELKAIKDAGKIDDPVSKRAIDVIYLSLLEKQLDTDLMKEMNKLGNEIEEIFTNFRAEVSDGKGGKKVLDDNQVREILKTSTLSERRKETWEAAKLLGARVEPGLKKLVKLRNQAAKKLGFKNYHAMLLALREQDGDGLITLFDRLDELTREPFRKAKVEIDVELAKACGIKVADLMPWHYHDQFFQEVPSVFKADLDKIYQNQDIIALSRDFYAGIGLPIDLVIEKTGNDFKPRKGKNQHAFSTDITRDGRDVRVLANVVPNEQWMATMLHEFGHSVYTSINIPEKLPYVLRTESHILTTEGVAMLFEKMSKRRLWLEKMGVKVDDPKAFDEAGSKMLRYQLLVFSRWCQVMLRFEKGMYENPDQDLNKLWWDMVEKYQALRRPEGRNAPDYAAKYHIVGAPVYYHNYMMGELFASQVHHTIARKVYKGADPNAVVYVGNKDVGAYMRRFVFEPGATMTWSELTRYATDADLSPDAFAKDFGGK